MSENVWRGQTADIEIERNGTAQTVGIVDNVEITPEKDVQQLRGASSDGTITWQDLQQTSLEVSVSGDIMEWDLDTWKAIVGYDEAVDELRSDAEVPTFSITVLYQNAEGNTAAFPIPEAFDESLPLGGSREEWIGMSLDATGRTIEGVDDESDAEVT